MKIMSKGSTISGATHHRAAINGSGLHYVSAGIKGAPILLVHRFPEGWGAFHKGIPQLAERHRVYAVDLPRFGYSDIVAGTRDNAAMADDLHALIRHLDVGQIHILAQDCSGPAVFRLAAKYPKDLSSSSAVETGLPGLGLEVLATPWSPGNLASLPRMARRMCSSGARNKSFWATSSFQPPLWCRRRSHRQTSMNSRAATAATAVGTALIPSIAATFGKRRKPSPWPRPIH